MKQILQMAFVAFIVAFVASFITHLAAKAMGIEDTGIFAAATMGAIMVGISAYLQNQKKSRS